MKNLYQSLLLTLLLWSGSQLYAQTPIYNSYPSAQPVLLLDFDGHNVEGTSWNTTGPILCAPANLKPEQVTEVFNRVAEDYRPFAVNVTTDEARYQAAPANRRMRVILTTTWEWYGKAGGVAFIGSFTWGDNTPAFVFTSLHNYNVKNIAEATSHEAGHTFGLSHQARFDEYCVKKEEYNSGTGSGVIGWAPIMGVGYYRNQTTWHNGPKPKGCSDAQDDLAIITSRNGFTYRTDDHSADFRKATATTFQNNRFQNEGLINTSADEDVFEFKMAAASRLKMKVAPNSVGVNDNGSNLDVQVKLLDSKGQVLNSYNEPLLMSASLDTTLPAGTYFVAVSGTGNTYTADYASMGAYTLEAEQSPLSVLPLRTLELKGSTEGAGHKLNWVIDADEAIVSQVLEVSSDGSRFEAIAELAAADRAYKHLPATSSTLQYRLNVTFDNGRQYYSNVIALRSNLASSKPQLFTNIIRSGAVMLNSPASFTYIINDYSGRILAKGALTQGASSINVSNLAGGSYLIRFTNGQDQYVEKFIKQ